MKRPGFLEGVGVAIIGGALAGIAWTLLSPLFPFSLLARVLVTAVAGGYLLYLLARGGLRAGRVTTVVAWGAMSAILMIVDASLLVYVLAQASAVWLVRVVTFQAGALAALGDLSLIGIGLVAAAWAMVETGSAALAAWCLLLVQAAFPCIPGFGARRSQSDDDSRVVEDPFERAHRAAQTALVRLASHR